MTVPLKTRILLADDHTLVRSGLRRILEAQPGFEVVGEAGDGAEALRLARTTAPDVTVLDLGDWYRAVTVLGRVVELRDDEGLVDIDRLSQRYRGAPYWNRGRPRVTALVEPERWHEHS